MSTAGTLDVLRDNLAAAAAYGIVGVALLVVAFGALDLVTPGRLRTLVWVDRNRNAIILVVAEVTGLALVLLASTFADDGLGLWQGVGYSALYTLVAIAVMMWSFVLIDWLTPGKLGSELLTDEHHPAGWINAAVFVGIGAVIAGAIAG